MDLALSLTTSYHFSRQDADYGKKGISNNKETNEYMKKHSDMDFSIFKGKKYGLNDELLDGINNYIINPDERNAYFPNETLEINGEINWQETIPMLSSWLVAGAITNFEQRFNDLKNRRSLEIGKLELDFIKKSIDKKIDVIIPSSILEQAKYYKEFEDINNNNFNEYLKKGKISNELMGIWILDGYKKWTNKVINEFCKICNIDNFDVFLKNGINVINNKEKENEINKYFTNYLGRELNEYEYIPYLPGIEIVFKRLSTLKLEQNKEKTKENISNILKNINKVVRRINK